MSLLCNCVLCPIRSKSILSGISEEILKELESLKVTNLYRKGQAVFYEGNLPFGVYCLKSGKVKLFKSSPQGKNLIMKIAGEGSLLGFRYLINNEIYSVTAETLEDSTVCFIDKDKFFGLIKKYPPLILKLLDIMGKEIRKLQENAKRMAFNSSDERVVKTLLSLNESFGVKSEDNKYKIDVLLTRHDLAGLTGTTTETVVRTISRLKEKKILRTDKKFLHITDLKALERLIPH